MQKIICQLPKAGLANQLFLIASAELYANKYDLKVHYMNKWQIKLGPYLRREKNKRNYFGFFKFQKIEPVNSLLSHTRLINKIIVMDPKLEEVPKISSTIIFKTLPHYSNYFGEYIPYRELVKKLIFNQLSTKIQKQINELPEIDVAVHVRLGDYQMLKDGADFNKAGTTRTPMDYFINEIEKIQKYFPEFIFHVFSDGYAEELAPLTKINNVICFDTINDIIDLYQMSKSKILITSSGSTYSYWAGFLGECKIIQHPSHSQRIK